MSEQTTTQSLNSENSVDTAIRAWIQNEAVAIDISASSAFDAAIDRLVGSLDASVELLGFGEALHGGEEILQFRNRLFQRLVEQHGYRVIAIESSFPWSRVVNDYVTGRSSGDYDTIENSGFSHGFGHITANRELVEWMRQLNTNRAEADQVHFYGFDSPTDMVTDSPRQLLTFVLDYLAAIDRDAATHHRDQIEPLLGEDARWENPDIAMNPELGIGLSPDAMALRIATENLISDLSIKRPEYAAAQGMERFVEAMHYATAARQLLNYHAVLSKASAKRQGTLLSLRAAMMLDNLSYIVSRERPRGKVLAFAHNAHLQRRKVEWQFGDEQVHWWPVGVHLQVLFDSAYAVIATAVGNSPDNGLGEPEAKTLEALLTETETPVTLLPTHRGCGLPADALQTMPLRSGSASNWSYSALTPRTIEDFDWLLTFGRLSYHRRSESAAAKV